MNYFRADMKKIFLISLMLCIPHMANASSSKDYSSAISYISEQESKLKQCALEKQENPSCYTIVNSNYLSLIRDIRSNHSNRLDEKLWQQINIGFKKQVDNCKSDAIRPRSRLLYFPYGECKSNGYHSFAIATVELHLR